MDSLRPSQLDEEHRVLAIDYGQKRIGLAVSDPTGNFAVGLNTLELTYKTNLMEELTQTCQTYHVVHLVVGLPKNMNGSEGPQAERVRAFAAQLQEATNLPITFLDERLTSVLANRTLREQGLKPSRKKGMVDEVAAKYLLQDYLGRCI